jgi:hypothetical protein
MSIQSNKEHRTNQHLLVPFLFPITYESADIITSLELPRKYTSIYNDITQEIYLNVGHNYNKRLLSKGVIKNETYIIGKWIEKENNYEIHIKISVSTTNPESELRNKPFCQKLSKTLEGIAFAETALLLKHPSLASTKIFIEFRYTDRKYNRIEYWHRIGYWTQDCMRDPSEVVSKSIQKPTDIDNKKISEISHTDDSNYLEKKNFNKKSYQIPETGPSVETNKDNLQDKYERYKKLDNIFHQNLKQLPEKNFDNYNEEENDKKILS